MTNAELIELLSAQPPNDQVQILVDHRVIAIPRQVVAAGTGPLTTISAQRLP
jgi:hypothetical protein